MSFTIRLLIWFKGKFVGNDSFGNRYYEEKPKSVNGTRQARRWIIYKSEYDASKIPPEWHAWLHYRADKPLSGQIFDLQNPEQESATRTCKTLCNHENTVKNGNVVRLATKIKRPYQPWTPNE